MIPDIHSFMNSRRGGQLYCFALGVIAVLGQAPFHLWFITIVCLACLVARLKLARKRDKPNILGFSDSFCFAFGYFIFMAFQSATIYYFTVSEIQEEPQTPQGKMVRVSGKLIPESFYRPEESTEAYFTLTDGTTSMSAKHDGILPDLFFNKNSEIFELVKLGAIQFTLILGANSAAKEMVKPSTAPFAEATIA